MSFRNDVFEMLGTGDVRGASFTNAEGETVQVILVRAVNNRAAFHPPEYCLTGGGRELVDQRVVTVSAPGKEPFPCAVNEMVFKERSGRRLLVWNWYLVGTAMMPNFYKQQVKLFTDIFTGGSGAGAMINMYTEVQDGNVDAATRRVTDLSYAILPLLREPQ
jgi:EpsI family protein